LRRYGRLEREWRPGAAWQAAEVGEPRLGEVNVKKIELLADLHGVPFGQHVFGYLDLIVLTVVLRQAIPMTFAKRYSTRWVMLPRGFELVFAVAV
jgi:hypothetical protein